MPTSVLLAVLAAAGLLALAPALVRRYDATERLAAERAQSTARVLDRTRRRRTVPVSGRPRYLPATDQGDGVPATDAPSVGRAVWLKLGSARTATVPAPDPMLSLPVASAGSAGQSRSAPRPAVGRASVVPAGRAAGVAAGRGPARPPSTRSVGIRQPSTGRQPVRRPGSKQQRNRVPQSAAIYRRRRVLALLVVLNVIELIGVTTVSSGFWTGFAVTLLLLVGYVVHLRNSSIADARVRRIEARRAAVIAAEQAMIRETHVQRLAARREALRRAASARATAQRDAQRLSQRYVDYDPQRGARVRGRSYEQGAGYDERAAGF